MVLFNARIKIVGGRNVKENQAMHISLSEIHSGMDVTAARQLGSLAHGVHVQEEIYVHPGEDSGDSDSIQVSFKNYMVLHM